MPFPMSVWGPIALKKKTNKQNLLSNSLTFLRCSNRIRLPDNLKEDPWGLGISRPKERGYPNLEEEVAKLTILKCPVGRFWASPLSLFCKAEPGREKARTEEKPLVRGKCQLGSGLCFVSEYVVEF